MLNDLQLNGILQDFDIAYWKIDLLSKKISWSPHFYSLVGEPDKKQDTLEYFINEILHKDYRYDFREFFERLTARSETFTIELRLKLETGKYRWFECRKLKSSGKDTPDSAVLLFINIHQIKRDEYTIEENFFYYRETAEMTSTGGWYLDLKTGSIYWDNVTKKLLACPRDYEPSPEDNLGFFGAQHREKAREMFEKCEKYGIPFVVELKMRTHHHREFWVKATGKPVYNSNQEVTGIRGIYQDINENKNNEINLQSSLDIIAAQNARLFNFSHIVSHHLRSHSSNLSLISQLLKEAKTNKDKLDLLSNIEGISDNLEGAIRHLNSMMTEEAVLEKEKKPISFHDILEDVTNSTSSLIKRENAQIIAEFDKLNEINYISEYLQSILLNLITNSIRFRHPGRKPVIFIETFQEKGASVMEVSDNGLGIDLSQHSDKLFGMYNTFHDHPESKGIGLFITKNQIETMGGNISVRSTVNIGTTFKVTF